MSPIRIAYVLSACALSAYVLASAAHAQSWAASAAAESATAERVENGIPISRLLAIVQKKTHKLFIIDPRVRGDVVLLDKDVSDLGYDDLLKILHVYNFIAAENGPYVEVLPIANARQTAGPVISGKEKLPDDEIVTKVLGAKNISVTQLVPILRPMIPQYGHLAALPCVNKLIMVDTYANVRRIEEVIASLDVGEPYKPEKCEGRLLSEH
jgi:general secretion pathway protein D